MTFSFRIRVGEGRPSERIELRPGSDDTSMSRYWKYGLDCLGGESGWR